MVSKVQCPNPECGKAYTIADDQLGRTAVCRHCGREFTLSASERPTPAPSAQFDTGQGTSGASSPGDLPKRLGRFEILARVGSGAFGTVYWAHDPVLDREVALKVPRAAALEKPEARARFLREPKAAAQLRHPNIVPVYDAGTAEGRYYIASAYIQGRTLEDVIDHERLDFRRAAEIVRGVANALDYSHGMGVVHRDVKPANVMIDGRGEPMLMDFGLAHLERSEDKLTHDGAIMGTPAYMAPEQADRSFGEVGPASDQYSLGVVLYELLTGETPFSGPPTVLLFNIVSQEPDQPRTKCATIPKDLETICLKAMSKRPQERYADCGGMAEDLRCFLADRPILARALGPVERTIRWARRNRMLAASTVAAFILLLAVIGVVTVANVRVSNALATARTALHKETSARQEADRERDAATRATDAARIAQKEETAARKEADAQRETAELAAENEAKMRREASVASQRAEYNLYCTQIMLARQKWAERDRASVADTLNACPPDLRNWEWGYLQRVCGLTVRELQGFSGQPGTASSGGHLAVSGDGNRIACAFGGSLRVWDANTGEELAHISAGNVIGGFAIAPNGELLAVATHVALKLWNVSTSAEMLTFREIPVLRKDEGVTYYGVVVNCVAFDPGGTRVLAGDSAGKLSVWEVATGRQLLSFNDPSRGSVEAVAYSPDGKYIASSGGYLMTVTGEVVAGSPGYPNRLAFSHVMAFSPDGKRTVAVVPGVYVTSDHRRTWKMRPERLVVSDATNVVSDATGTGGSSLPLEGHQGKVLAVAFSPDDKRIASGGADQTARIWDAATGRELLALHGHRGPVTGVAFLSGGQGIAAASRDGTVKLYHFEENLFAGDDLPAIQGHSGAVSDLEFAPDGRRLASGGEDGKVKIWDAAKRVEIVSISAHESPVTSVTFDPGGNRIASSDREGSLRLWAAEDGTRLLSIQAHQSPISAIVFGPDGRWIASAADLLVKREVEWVKTETEQRPRLRVIRTTPELPKIWDATTGEETGKIEIGRAGQVFDLALSPDGKRIAAARPGIIFLLDAVTGQFLSCIDHLHAGDTSAIAFSSEEGRLASCGTDGSVKIWDTATREALLVLHGHVGAVRSIAFSPDGKRIISGGEDGTVRMWDAVSGHNFLTLRAHDEGVSCVAFSPDGLRFASGSDDGLIQLWQAADWRDGHAEVSTRQPQPAGD